ncbi:MAG: hypothetical protein JNK05_25110 [Myxococcales bacterium]|nr:hypothetical protein [Myxococcales bacterium]
MWLHGVKCEGRATAFALELKRNQVQHRRCGVERVPRPVTARKCDVHIASELLFCAQHDDDAWSGDLRNHDARNAQSRARTAAHRNHHDRPQRHGARTARRSSAALVALFDHFFHGRPNGATEAVASVGVVFDA